VGVGGRGGQESVISIASRYRLDGPGSNLPVRARGFPFTVPVQIGPGAHPAPSTMGTRAVPWG